MLYSRCIFATLIPLTCSTIAVVWQLGLLRALGFGLDPYSMLVPFLVFAIGISHGVQIINNIAVRFFFGAGPLWSARRAFRALHIPGLVALVSDGIGFLTLMVIEIPVIQELALTASIGVGVLIFTNLILLPVLMSYVGLSKPSVRYLQRKKENPSKLWPFIAHFAKPPFAPVTIVVAIALFGLGFYGSKDLRIGDLDAGAPELRPVYDQHRCLRNNGADRTAAVWRVRNRLGGRSFSGSDEEHRGCAIGDLAGRCVETRDHGHERGQPEVAYLEPQPVHSQQLAQLSTEYVDKYRLQHGPCSHFPE
jgi:hypothetical protein